MTDEQLAVHERLLASLPVRTHSENPAKKIQGKHKWPRPIILLDKPYRSLYAAARATGYSRQLISQWIARGHQARYADE